jgi:hypothetical protein
VKAVKLLKGSGIIVIPALPNSGPTNLCPVRTLLKYLDTAFGVRSKDSNRLFVHYHNKI